MVTVDTIARVRRAYFVQKRKIKAIARDLKLARNTVRDIVRRGSNRAPLRAQRTAAAAVGTPRGSTGADAWRERAAAQARTPELFSDLLRAPAGRLLRRLRCGAPLRAGVGGARGRAHGGRLRTVDLCAG